jgi:uncharacterized protein (TIGR00299 family) protein
MHIHLDPAGGIAGDMFAAALLDAFPEHAAGAIRAACALAPVQCRVAAHRDATLAGSRFVVDERGQNRGHHHVHWSDIRASIAGSALPEAVRAHAIGIFAHLAEAEARVHGIAADDVAFHEVGAADSIADILAAAWLIDALGAVTWSVASLPLGSGMVRTAHGLLPVPAPATVLLLEHLATHDDGVAGERVTPTGAAILRYLQPGARLGGRIARQGMGFGTRTLPGMSNVLRAIAFDTAPPAASQGHRELLVVSFEIDDQSGEDLAAGVAHLRALEGVHDVLLLQAFGKKNRLATQVQVLAAPERTEAVVAACFAQTTTIGLRTQIVAARALPRRMAEATVDGTHVRVKIVERPGGTTGKAEADDVAQGATHAQRISLRRRAEESFR